MTIKQNECVDRGEVAFKMKRNISKWKPMQLEHDGWEECNASGGIWINTISCYINVVTIIEIVLHARHIQFLNERWLWIIYWTTYCISKSANKIRSYMSAPFWKGKESISNDYAFWGSYIEIENNKIWSLVVSIL